MAIVLYNALFVGLFADDTFQKLRVITRSRGKVFCTRMATPGGKEFVDKLRTAISEKVRSYVEWNQQRVKEYTSHGGRCYSSSRNGCWKF